MDVLVTYHFAAKKYFECNNYLNQLDKCIVNTINKNIDTTITNDIENVDTCINKYKSYLQYYCRRPSSTNPTTT
jgi:hypothetical protein